jgi:2',3'-cyclic-nucleotide 2'-phosphodiesterase (5'-nucleotidase family)
MAVIFELSDASGTKLETVVGFATAFARAEELAGAHAHFFATASHMGYRGDARTISIVASHDAKTPVTAEVG